MTPYYTQDGMTLYHGDCREVMAQMPANSLSAIVTDPPYALVGASRNGSSQPGDLATPYGRSGPSKQRGFMGQEWDGRLPGVEVWREALRVLKPGGHLLAFSSPRTQHRLACAIEDAGFDIRDGLMWIFGSGFPKSLNISKTIDKQAGMERKVIGDNPHHRANHLTDENTWRQKEGRTASPQSSPVLTAPATDAAKLWEGFGSALKPSFEPILHFQKPYEPSIPQAEPIILARKPLDGTLVENCLAWNCGPLNIDAGRVGTGGDRSTGGLAKKTSLFQEGQQGERPIGARWPATVITDGSACVRAGFPETTSGTKKQGTPYNHSNCHTLGAASGSVTRDYPGDTGSALRFFQQCPFTDAEREEQARWYYSGKASRSERGDGNGHPTVKPLALMTYLLRLVQMPSNNLICDPFAGSGTTLLAAHALGLPCIGIEQSEEYCAIIAQRLTEAQRQQRLF